MKANLLSFIRGLKNGTPPRFQSYLKSLTLLLVMLMSVNVWGEEYTLSPSGGASQQGFTISCSSVETEDFRVYKGSTMTITSTVGKMTNIALTFSSSYDGGGWSSSYQPNSETWTSPAAKSGSSGKQARITKIVVTVAGSAKTLTSIAISGTPTKTTYEAGESFEYAGLTATGKYSDNSEENITNSVEWTCSEEPLQQGTTSITVTATKGETFGSTTINGLTVTQALGDKLTLGSTGVTGTSYTAWTNKTGSQGVAKYAGKSAGSNNSIQLNSTSPNGIVSTTSAGLIKKVKVDWESHTSDGRYITIYGSNTAYTGSADVYKRGTSLGTIKKGTNTELTITGDYAYVGVKANDPLYMNSISFVWETALIFNLNGGDGTKPNSITSFPATLPATTSFTKSGYRPNGWNTKADGTGTHYNDGVSFEEPELTTTLYVEWKKVYTMTYNGNSNTEGSVPVDNNSPYDENNSVTVLGNIGNLERTGYTWSGWNTKSDGTGTTYQAESTFDITSNTTLYAKWTAKNYTVTFNKNSEEAGGSMDPQPFAFDEQKALTENEFTAPAHKHFAGWAETSDGTVAYADKANYKLTTEGATLYAVWDWNKTTITLNQQEGSGGTSSVTATYDQAMPTLSTAPSRNGYDFAGYYSEPNGAGTKYYNADKSSAATWLSDDKSATLYAHWTPKTISVTFDENGHGVADGSATIVFNTTELINPTLVTASTGYTLNGYYTSSSNGSKVVNVDGTLVPNVSNYTDENGKWIQYINNKTLYAQYSPINYPVKWMVNGEEWKDKGGSVNADYDDKIAAVPTAPGTSDCDFTKVFVGWTENKIDGTTDTEPSDLFTDAAGAPLITGNTTYYAVFALPEESATDYAKGTLADLQTGKKVLLVHNNTKAVSSVSSTANYLDAVSVSVVDSKIAPSDASIIWNVTKNGNIYKFDQGGNKRLNVNETGLYANTTDGSFVITGSSPYELKDASVTAYIDYMSYSNGFTKYTNTHSDNYIDFYLPATTYSEYATTCVECTNVITISKGEEVEHGSYNLSKTGDVCLSNIPGGTYSVTITATPDEHYHLATVTTSSGTVGEVVDNTCVVSGITANTTLTAVFEEDPKVTVTWHKGATTETTSNIYVGTLYSGIAEFAPTVADDAAGDCANKFMGWATKPIDGSEGVDESDVAWVTDEYVIDDTHKDIHAVFATKEGTGGDFTLVSGVSQLGEGEAYIGSYISYSGYNYYVATSASDIATTTLSNNVLTPTAAMLKLTLVSTGTANQYYLKDANGKYLHASSTGVNPTLSETACAWTFSGESSLMGMKSSLGSNVYLCAYSSNGTTGKLKTYSSASGNTKICVYLSSATYSNYITQCCQAPTQELAITPIVSFKKGQKETLHTTGGNENDVTWSASSGIVTINETTGEITGNTTGNVVITAHQEAKGDFCEQTAVYNLSVISASQFGILLNQVNGGSVVAKNVGDIEVDFAEKDDVITIIATPEDDYNFTGWEVNAGGVILEDASALTTTFIMGEADVEITPSFALKQFTITLDAGNGKVDELSVKKLENQDIHSTITLPDAVACNSDEWEFKGWATSSVTETAIEPTFVSSTDYEVTDNITLYAVYGQTTTVDGDYIYKIYAQVGNEKKYMKGEPVASSTKVNQVLAGAETEAQTYTLVTIDASKYALKYTADATSKYLHIYKDGSNYYLQSTTSLSDAAYWTMLDGAKGGKIFMNVQFDDYGLIYRESTTKAFKVYSDISTKVTAASTEYYDLNLQVVGREQTTGGVWNSNPSCTHHYQVTYDGNGTTTACEGGKFDAGSYTICTTAPTRAGYEFGGWKSSADNQTYAAGATYDLQADVTFTAVWNPIKIQTITLNKTEASLEYRSDDDKTPTVQLSVASTTPEEVADNTVTWSVTGDAATVDNNGLVTAVKTGTATITATANDGSEATASCTITVKKTYKLTITDTEGVKNIKVNGSSTKTQYIESGTEIALTKTITQGYTFEAWIVKQGETPITVTADKFPMPEAEVSVTAEFGYKQDTYVDDMNNNVIPTESTRGQYTIPTLPNADGTATNGCEQTHLYFVGWIEGDIGEGQTDMPTGLITAGTENKAASGKTYHAVWAEDSNNNQ